MKVILICLALLCLLSNASLFPTEENGVIVLTSGNINEAIASHDNLIIEFYAPW
jgi:hypothetical protein